MAGSNLILLPRIHGNRHYLYVRSYMHEGLQLCVHYTDPYLYCIILYSLHRIFIDVRDVSATRDTVGPWSLTPRMVTGCWLTYLLVGLAHTSAWQSPIPLPLHMRFLWQPHIIYTCSSDWLSSYINVLRHPRCLATVGQWLVYIASLYRIGLSACLVNHFPLPSPCSISFSFPDAVTDSDTGNRLLLICTCISHYAHRKAYPSSALYIKHCVLRKIPLAIYVIMSSCT
jgi:hypothetical protein